MQMNVEGRCVEFGIAAYILGGDRILRWFFLFGKSNLLDIDPQKAISAAPT